MPTPPRSVLLTKRLVDLAVGGAVALAAAPIAPWIALAIRLDDGGPVFYRQRRARSLAPDASGSASSGPSLHFDSFDVLKFRTMRVDAERATGAVVAAEGDARVTRVGRFLRRSRLDELPQLIHVLTGEMSLVGPRPERPELLSNLAFAIPFFEERLRGLKPGLTGLSQVSLGYTGRPLPGSPLGDHERTLIDPYDLPETEGNLADDMRMKLLLDLAYAASLESLGSYLRMELSILLRTPIAMLRGAGR